MFSFHPCQFCHTKYFNTISAVAVVKIEPLQQKMQLWYIMIYDFATDIYLLFVSSSGCCKILTVISFYRISFAGCDSEEWFMIFVQKLNQSWIFFSFKSQKLIKSNNQIQFWKSCPCENFNCFHSSLVYGFFSPCGPL